MLKLMYITNNPVIAEIADKAWVDRIFIDLEVIGKKERQRGMDTVQSNHSLSDIPKVKAKLNHANLLVRSNPIHDGSKEEINSIIENGADIIMLPFFKSVDEVKTFLNIIDGRVKTMLLVETKEAVDVIDDILALDGIDEMYIGLNDLHLSYGLTFMFELLSNGTVDRLAEKFKSKGIPFGFGGIAKIGGGLLPAEHVIAEHYRIGSTRGILSRSFCNCEAETDINTIETIFQNGVSDIRILENNLQGQTSDFFEGNKAFVSVAVEKIVEIIKSKR